MKIRTGIASYGLSGSVFHAPFINLHEGFELCTIVERTKTLSQERYPNVKIVKSFEEMIADDSLELIVVNTPHVTHYDYCKAALLAGKHVVVEKPFVFDLGEADELKQLADQKKKLLIVFQNRRWDGDFQTVKNVIDSGALGRVVEFVSSYLIYRPLRYNTWKEVPDKRTGITYDLGAHLVDQALQLFGKPTGVWATQDILRDGSKINDYFMINLLYPKLKVTLKASYTSRGDTTRFVVNGTNGSFVKHGLDPQEEALKAGGMPGNLGWGEEPESAWGVLNSSVNGIHVKGKVETVAGNYMSFYENVYDCLRNGGTPFIKTSEVIDELVILDAAYLSSETGKVIKI